MALREHQLTLELEHSGKRFYDFEDYELDSSYTTPTDGWSCTLFWGDDRAADLRRSILPLQPVKLYIDEHLQVVGRIDKTESAGPGGTALRVSGRDYLAELVDGGVDPTLRFKKEQDLGDAVLSIVRPFGIRSVFGDGNLTRNILTGRKPFSGPAPRDFKAAKLDEFKAGDNEGAWQVVAKLAARHGFMLQPTMDRESAALTAPEYRQAPIARLTRPGNIIRANCSRDYSNVPTVTIATGRTGTGGKPASGMYREQSTFGDDAPSAIGSLPEVKQIAFPDGTPAVLNFRLAPGADIGNAGLLYRPMYYKDEDSRNQEQLDRGVKRMIAERLRPTLEYSATVRGHGDPETGALYAVDTIIHVSDGIEDVDEDLWVLQRTFRNDGNTGPTTDLKLIRPESYVI